MTYVCMYIYMFLILLAFLYRSRKTRSNDQNADPLKTRANNCGAYVSVKLDEQTGQMACIIREMLQHSGHDPTNPEERHVSRIDAALIGYIYTLIDQV